MKRSKHRNSRTKQTKKHAGTKKKIPTTINIQTKNKHTYIITTKQTLQTQYDNINTNSNETTNKIKKDRVKQKHNK